MKAVRNNLEDDLQVIYMMKLMSSTSVGDYGLWQRAIGSSDLKLALSSKAIL